MSFDRTGPRPRLPLGWMIGVVCAFGAGAGLSAALLSTARPSAAAADRGPPDLSERACRATLLMTALGRATSPGATTGLEMAAPVGELDPIREVGQVGQIDDGDIGTDIVAGDATSGAYFATAAAVHAADAVDADWSRHGEEEIGKLVAARAPAFSVDRVDCRTRTCAAELRPAGPAATATALEELVNGAGSAFSEVSVDRHPSGALTLYLARADRPAERDLDVPR